MAAVAAPAKRETANDLGIQDTLLGRAVPAGREEDHFRGCGSGLYSGGLITTSLGRSRKKP